jgi:alkaline phosphatase
MYKKCALICSTFLLIAVAGFSQKRNKHPKNIILMIGDGMGVAQI